MTPFLAAGDWIQLLIVLGFFLVSALAQYIQKRANEKRKAARGHTPGTFRTQPVEAGEQPQVPREARDEPDRPVPVEHWEEQFRRLFEAPRDLAPPPPVLPSSQPEIPGPFQANRPRVEEDMNLEDVVVPEGPEAGAEWISGARLSTTSKLNAAAAAYREGSNLRQIVESRLRAARERRGLTTVRAVRARRSALAASVFSMFRKPETIRQALIAAAVFQPCKAHPPGHSDLP